MVPEESPRQPATGRIWPVIAEVDCGAPQAQCQRAEFATERCGERCDLGPRRASRENVPPAAARNS